MRKQPQQQRSRELVNIILQATEKAVCLYGLEGMTTPKVAELAGVSVGSLYQYFEDKQSLMESLLEQKGNDIGLQIRQLLNQHSHQDLPTLVRLSIVFGFELINQNQFYRQVISHWHNLPQTRATEVMQQHFFVLGQQVLLRHQQGINLNPLATKLFIIINSTMYCMQRYTAAPAGLISQDEMIEQLSLMVMSYLQA